MKNAAAKGSVLPVISLVALISLYTAVSNAYRFVDAGSLPEPLRSALRPDVLPPTQAIAEALAALVTGPAQPSQVDPPAHAGHHHAHSIDHVGVLLQQGVTLQASLAITVGRVLFGLAVGAPLGIAAGLLMGWSRRADQYLHPLYVLIRSVPPLAFITYIMLWLGHGEAHRLIPIVYAVAATLVIPAYHAVRDVTGAYVVAARSLGARGLLLVKKILLPATAPALLGGLRYALAIAWMTAVGAEMLMAENGMGNLIVGGGMWASRLQTRSDPAVVIVGIMAIAAAGWAMDAAAKVLSTRLTRWAR
jgi:ABC-type nitrate/sulfonate/bicarbonate transport system permease component